MSKKAVKQKSNTKSIISFCFITLLLTSIVFIPGFVFLSKYLNLKDNYETYDKDYNDIVIDKYQTKDVFMKDIENLINAVFISEEEIDGINTIKPILNINKLIEYYKDKEINAHYLKPNYLKKIDAEDKL